MDFNQEIEARLGQVNENSLLRHSAAQFMQASINAKYSYNFSWLGRPVIQYPQDIVAFQEIIWKVKPDLIIETGIAHGGSLMLSASMLALLDFFDAQKQHQSKVDLSPKRKVLGVDIEIRKHNRDAIEAHPLNNYITMIEGSSIEKPVVDQVKAISQEANCVLVCLDSNHSHEHVIAELDAYAPMVTDGSYCIVFDTVVENLDESMNLEKPWSVGNNPMTAIKSWLPKHPEFVVDHEIDKKLLISVAPNGYLKKVVT